MVDRYVKTLLMVIALSLALATSASAECAWALWTKIASTVLPDDDWGVVIAYPTMRECEAALADDFNRQRREGWQVNYVQVRTTMASMGKGEKITIRHARCLPDTIDPRGPKVR